MNINQVLLFRIQKFGVVILNAKNMFFFKIFAPPKIYMEPKKASDVKSGKSVYKHPFFGSNAGNGKSTNFAGMYHLHSHRSCEGLLLKSMVFDWPVLHPMVLLGKPRLELRGLTGDAGSPAGDLASQKDSKGKFFSGFLGFTVQKWWF